MNSNPQQQKQLDYPVWRLNFREYGELKGYDLSQTESATQWFDCDREPFDDSEQERKNVGEYGDQCIYCGKDAYTCEHYEEPNHE